MTGGSRISAGAALMGLRGEPLILATLSPRRRMLIEMLGIPYRAIVPDVPEEWPGPGEPPDAYVERLAREKALWVPARDPAIAGTGAYAVLAADTVVVLDGKVLEKPADPEDAKRMLAQLSGRWNEVYTGVCLRRLSDERVVAGHERSRVLFSTMAPEVIDAYVGTGEPMDKAGAYGIQGYGGLLIDRIEGDYFNVMGLPLPRLRRLAHELEG